MEKKRLLYWLSITVVLLLFTFVAYSSMLTEEQMQAFREKYKGLVPDAKAIEKVREQFKGLTEMKPKTVPSGRELMPKNDLMIDTDSMLSINEEIMKKKNEREEYIFYLFSASVPEKVIDSVFMQSKKLKHVNFQGVVRGLSEKLMGRLQNMESFDGITVRPNPFIFRNVDASVVPAFVYASCPASDNFDASLCDYRCIVYGDTSLLGALYEMKDVCKETARYYVEIKNAF